MLEWFFSDDCIVLDMVLNGAMSQGFKEYAMKMYVSYQPKPYFILPRYLLEIHAIYQVTSLLAQKKHLIINSFSIYCAAV